MIDEREVAIKGLIDDGGFTQDEAICLHHITQAWNIYTLLPVQHSSERGDFLIAIHRLQDLMAMRVSRRDHPRIWPLGLTAGLAQGD